MAGPGVLVIVTTGLAGLLTGLLLEHWGRRALVGLLVMTAVNVALVLPERPPLGVLALPVLLFPCWVLGDEIGHLARRALLRLAWP